jgi:hypothetical protein
MKISTTQWLKGDFQSPNLVLKKRQKNQSAQANLILFEIRQKLAKSEQKKRMADAVSAIF